VVTSFDLRQSRFHTVDDAVLDLQHGRSERLIELDYIGFPFLEIAVDGIVEAIGTDRLAIKTRCTISERNKGLTEGRSLLRVL
jgi:hypothetical protein